MLMKADDRDAGERKCDTKKNDEVHKNVIKLEAGGARYTAWTEISMGAQFGASNAHCPQGCGPVGGPQGAASGWERFRVEIYLSLA